MKPPQRGFATPPEIIRFFDDKSLKPGFSWLDVWGEEHAYAFTVAKAVDLELLDTFKKSIKGAIERGEGFETWRQGLIQELQKLGWYGPRKVDDPTGAWKSKVVDFSKPRRLETIFWSNVRSAHAAGQWERAQRTKAGLPYFLYVRTTSHEPRAEHLAWAGTMLPVDDPFWSTHFPPNGWGCKCSLRQITRFEYAKLKDREGYSTDRPAVEEVPHVNRRTGEIARVPAGIDPGWGTNPGLARARTLVNNVAARLDASSEEAARKAIGEIVASPAPKILLGIVGERLDLPVAVSGALRADWSAQSAIIAVSNEVMNRKITKHAPVDIDRFSLVQPIIDNGEPIDEGRGENRRTLVALDGDGKWWKLVLTKTLAGYMRVATLFHVRSGEVERLRRKGKSGGA